MGISMNTGVKLAVGLGAAGGTYMAMKPVKFVLPKPVEGPVAAVGAAGMGYVALKHTSGGSMLRLAALSSASTLALMGAGAIIGAAGGVASLFSNDGEEIAPAPTIPSTRTA